MLPISLLMSWSLLLPKRFLHKEVLSPCLPHRSSLSKVFKKTYKEYAKKAYKKACKKACKKDAKKACKKACKKGRKEGLLYALEIKFGTIEPEWRRVIDAIATDAELDKLGELIKQAGAADEFTRLLQQLSQ